MAYHVVLSGFHSGSELIVRAGLLGIIAYWLFRPEASGYFRGVRAAAVVAKSDAIVG
jgi:hypothetical protein